MKTKALVAALLLSVATPIFAQSTDMFIPMGPGPVVSGSVETTSLPARTRRFISAAFPGNGISAVTKAFADGTYNVALDNGIQLTVNNRGRVVNAKAPTGETIPVKAVRKMMKRGDYNQLCRMQCQNCVTEIQQVGNQETVTVNRPF